MKILDFIESLFHGAETDLEKVEKILQAHSSTVQGLVAFGLQEWSALDLDTKIQKLTMVTISALNIPTVLKVEATTLEPTVYAAVKTFVTAEYTKFIADSTPIVITPIEAPVTTPEVAPTA